MGDWQVTIKKHLSNGFNGKVFNSHCAKLVWNLQNFKSALIVASKKIELGHLILDEKPIELLRLTPELRTLNNDLQLVTIIKIIALKWLKHCRKYSQVCYLYPLCSNIKSDDVISSELKPLFRTVASEILQEIKQKNLQWLHKIYNTDDSLNALIILLITIKYSLVSCFDNNEQTKIADALCIYAPFFSHSCYPNATIYYDNDSKTIKIRAIESININTPITINYTNLYAFTEHRQKDLKYNFGFECHCERCLGHSPCELEQNTPCIAPIDMNLEIKLGRLMKAICKNYMREYRDDDTSHKKSIAAARIWLNEAMNYYSPLHPSYFKVIEFLAMTMKEIGEKDKSIALFERTLQMMDYVYPKFWYRKISVLESIYELSLGVDENKAASALNRIQELRHVTRGVKLRRASK